MMFPLPDDLLKQMLEDHLKQKEANAKKKNENGMNCTQCNFFNQYITEPNQDDGTYLCYKCRQP